MTQQIPAHAVCVHKGPIFSLYQRQQEMFDGSYKTFEYARRKDVVKALLIDNDCIIMTQEEQPGCDVKISFAGGFVEDQEDKHIAIQREITEETGYTFKSLELWIELPYLNMVE
jgi:8-oxo-dGTP pyrophosphatase MutT (NUDIX family)